MQKNKLFNSKHIILASKAKTQDEAFIELAQLAHKLGCITDQEALIAAFKKRENESSTGFEDGFAIPHARIKAVIKPAVLFVRYSQKIDWKAIDDCPTSVAIALILPESQAETMHMTILADIARKLIDDDFRNQLKIETDKEKIEKLLFDKRRKEQTNNRAKLILALTACPVGIAHTYLAADKLVEAGKKLGYNLRVETHGAAGVKGHFSDEEVAHCETVIVASDVALDMARFAGKKIYRCAVSQAIKDPVAVINAAVKTNVQGQKQVDFTTKVVDSGQKVGVMKHLMAGLSYMVPLVILGGIFIALSAGLGQAIYGPGVILENKKTSFLYYTDAIGRIAFILMIPILAAFIANSIAGRSAIAPALVIAYIGNEPEYFFPLSSVKPDTPTGFIGAIATGLAIGYTVKWINSWTVPKTLLPLMPIFVIPILVGFVYAMIMIFLVGSSIGWLMKQVQNWIQANWGNMNAASNIAIAFGFGLLIGLMTGFDMGGPVNKIAFLTCSGLIGGKIYTPMGAMACAIPVAPLGMGLTTFLFRSLFDDEQKTIGSTAFFMGCIGISEGAIPFAINDPKKVIACNMVGSGIAGAVAGLMGIGATVSHGGPIIALLGAMGHGNGNMASLGWVSGWLYSILALIVMFACALVTALMYGFWTVADKKRIEKKIIG